MDFRCARSSDRPGADFAGREQADQNCSRSVRHPGAAPAAGRDGVNAAKVGKLGQGDAELIQDAPQFGR